mmetsp:Transcript_85889/g.168020  ORF Transcript_85889/g.168020 Transcript_85889/m.168020 type:complete len:206 (-) Transcript_85889:319-936(-)
MRSSKRPDARPWNAMVLSMAQRRTKTPMKRTRDLPGRKVLIPVSVHRAVRTRKKKRHRLGSGTWRQNAAAVSTRHTWASPLRRLPSPRAHRPPLGRVQAPRPPEALFGSQCAGLRPNQPSGVRPWPLAVFWLATMLASGVDRACNSWRADTRRAPSAMSGTCSRRCRAGLLPATPPPASPLTHQHSQYSRTFVRRLMRFRQWAPL